MERIQIIKDDNCNGLIMGDVRTDGIVTVQGMAILNAAALGRHGISAADASALNKAGRWSELPGDCLRRIDEHADGVKLQREAAPVAIVDNPAIPAAARVARKRYGTFDRAWAAEDEYAAMLIKQYYYDSPTGESVDPVTKSDF